MKVEKGKLWKWNGNGNERRKKKAIRTKEESVGGQLPLEILREVVPNPSGDEDEGLGVIESLEAVVKLQGIPGDIDGPEGGHAGEQPRELLDIAVAEIKVGEEDELGQLPGHAGEAGPGEAEGQNLGEVRHRQEGPVGADDEDLLSLEEAEAAHKVLVLLRAEARRGLHLEDIFCGKGV